MRRLSYLLRPTDDTVRLMIYESSDGIYVFGYDDLADNASKWDNLFENIEDALEFCEEKYKAESWISIDAPTENCQHDWIQKVRIKAKENGKPEWGHFEQFINGRWTEISKDDKINSFGGMTGNERLWISGLMDVFDKSLKKDKQNAERILRALQWDEPSLKKILQ
jgi:hypothetical protein